MAKEKKPKFGAKVDETKQAKFKSPDSPIKFSWSFSILDSDGPYGWHQCQSHEKFLEILKKKGSFEKMTWSDLGQQGSHRVEVYKLSKDAQKRLQDIKLDDCEELFSFRVTGPNRVWCLQHGELMRVLWWDPDHQVCPSKLKHT